MYIHISTNIFTPDSKQATPFKTPNEGKSKYMYTCMYIFIYVFTPDSEQAARQPTAHHPTPE